MIRSHHRAAVRLTECWLSGIQRGRVDGDTLYLSWHCSHPSHSGLENPSEARGFPTLDADISQAGVRTPSEVCVSKMYLCFLSQHLFPCFVQSLLIPSTIIQSSDGRPSLTGSNWKKLFLKLLRRKEICKMCSSLPSPGVSPLPVRMVPKQLALVPLVLLMAAARHHLRHYRAKIVLMIFKDGRHL